MPSHRCSYYRGENTSEQKSMFRFPWNDSSRLKLWLDNCGNSTIAHLPKERLRSRYLCIDHFHINYVRNEAVQRKRIHRCAIPEPYKAPETSDQSCNSSPVSPELMVLRPTKVYKNNKRFQHRNVPENTMEENLQFEDHWSTPKKRKRKDNKENEQDTPKCKRLKTLLNKSHKKIKHEISKNKYLKKKIKDKNIFNLKKHKFSSKSSKLLTQMQLRGSKSKKQCTEEEKKFCMSLYYKSPSAYKFLVNSGVVLAAPSTIQRWLQETSCMPGLNEDVFDNLRNIFADKSIKERACAVCFDEMSIMADLEYTNKYDLIEGFEDFGGGDRNQKEAKYALVFIARGIYSNWKIPVAYFLSSKTVDSDKLGTILDSVINKLFDCGLLPKVTVCDQATTNVKLIKKLGANADFPFFFINGRKILYAIFDAPHLIKNVRNNLINNDFDLNGNQISFDDIINVYNIDKNNKSRPVLVTVTSLFILPWIIFNLVVIYKCFLLKI